MSAINEVTITVSAGVGSGKSALLGEIEIMCKALGVPVRYADEKAAQAEKNGTHADWCAALEMYKPSVVLVEDMPWLRVAPAQAEPSGALPKLPPLPDEPAGVCEVITGQFTIAGTDGLTGDEIECQDGYSADQMHEYATAYAKQAIEARGALSDEQILSMDYRGTADEALRWARIIESRILGQQGGGDAALLDWLDGEEFVALNCYVAVYDEHGQPLEKERKHYLIERESSIATVEAPTVREAIRAAIQAQAGDATQGGDRG